MKIHINKNQIKIVDCENILKRKKITGTRLASVLGLNKFNSPFAVWAEMVGLYKPIIPDKYLKVGQVLEKPIIKAIEEMYDFHIKTFDKNEIRFDNFKDNQIFGGIVDGIDENKSILVEIKTTNVKNKIYWNKKIPIEYWYQAQLYCELANLSNIMFGVCYIEDQDYENPNNILIDDRDIRIYPIDKSNIKNDMEIAEDWYTNHILNYNSPKFDMKNKNDIAILNDIKKKWKNYISE